MPRRLRNCEGVLRGKLLAGLWKMGLAGAGKACFLSSNCCKLCAT
jgi:hypothetical protein